MESSSFGSWGKQAVRYMDLKLCSGMIGVTDVAGEQDARV